MQTVEYYPKTMQSLNNWVLWRLEKGKKGKPTKVPYSPKYYGRAKSDDPKTWGSFDEVKKRFDRNKYSGLGFVFTEETGLVFTDCDHCIDNDGKMNSLAEELVKTLGNDTYIEVSQSGTGLHIIAFGKIPKSFNNQDAGVEMYSSGRFVAMTGQSLNGCEPIDKSAELLKVHEKYRTKGNESNKATSSTKYTLSLSDNDIIRKASDNEVSGETFRKLMSGDWEGQYNSQSEADLRLCEILAFWSDRDPATIERIFSSSGLSRDKWIKRRDYRQRTISQACNNINESVSEFRERKDNERKDTKCKPAQAKQTDADDVNEDVDESEAYTREGKDGARVVVDHLFAEYLVKKYHIKRINGQINIWRDQHYEPGSKYLESVIYQLEPELKSNRRSEIVKYIDCVVVDNSKINDFSDYIHCGSKILNWKTLELSDPSPDIVIQNQIPWEYNSNAYCADVDRAVDAWTCGDKQVRDLLFEANGCCLYCDTRFQKSFIYTGRGANGKSTSLDCTKRMLGEDNFSELDIAELSDRFSTASLVGKLANIGDDISSDYLQGRQLSVFKKLTTGNGLRAEKKGKDEFFFESTATLIFSANDIPKMSNDSQKSISRRLIIVPFDNDFSGQKADLSIKDKLFTQEAMEYLLKESIEGLRRVHRQGFTICERVVNAQREFERENNPLLIWLDQEIEDRGNESFIYETPVSTLHKLYVFYLTKIGTPERYHPTVEGFSTKMHHTLDLVSVRCRDAEGNRNTFFKKRTIPTQRE